MSASASEPDWDLQVLGVRISEYQGGAEDDRRYRLKAYRRNVRRATIPERGLT